MKLAIVQEWPTAGKRVTALAPATGNPMQIVVGDDAGNVVVWNTSDAKQPVKSMQTTGGEIRAWPLRPDGAKIVGLGGGNWLRVWNIAEGKQTAEASGDVRTQRQVALAERNVAVAKSQVAAEKALLADAEKLATAENTAAKKAEESKVAAEKAQKEAADAAKKATDDKLAAEKASADAGEVVKKAEEAKVAAETALTEAEAAEKGAADAKAAIEKTKAARAALVVAKKAALDAGVKAKAALAAIDKTLKPLETAPRHWRKPNRSCNPPDGDYFGRRRLEASRRAAFQLPRSASKTPKQRKRNLRSSLKWLRRQRRTPKSRSVRCPFRRTENCWPLAATTCSYTHSMPRPPSRWMSSRDMAIRSSAWHLPTTIVWLRSAPTAVRWPGRFIPSGPGRGRLAIRPAPRLSIA